ncbi:MAG: EscU/YscU/HrcU family type III secretion system export apparatus switch protein [Sphingomonadales bacterium]|nr:EscU/YscU/HrcU family type III secretion system export apparatus switch protein [Sphingomonadales bacterium]
MAESAGEKTLAPTPKRLRDAAEKGDVLRSKDLGNAAAMLVGAAFLRFGGPWLLNALGGAMRSGLVWDRAALDDFAPGRTLLALGLVVLPPILVLGAAVAAATLVSQLTFSSQGRFVAANMTFKASKINPMNGLARMFGPQGWIEAGKGLLKVGLLGAIAYGWSKGRVERMAALTGESLSGQLSFGWEALTSLFLMLSVGLATIALVDFPIQWWRRQRRLRMSLQEVKDENKESEGSPENKQAIRQRQRQVAMSAVAGAIRKAQFVITNPTHFSVAMTYDADLAPAPVVLAKGKGEKALAMRELAAEYGVPCIEMPALARSVYYTTRERQMIREELYQAIAGVLAFVFSLKRGENRPLPAIEVPVALRFDADGRLDPEATK